MTHDWVQISEDAKQTRKKGFAGTFSINFVYDKGEKFKVSTNED